MAKNRENDANSWSAIFDTCPMRDLFAVRDAASDAYDSLLAATVGFAWQLARRNPYTARLVCGATASWCEQLAAQPLFDVLRRSADCDGLLQLRLADDATFWSGLLGAGTAVETDIRRAAHLRALQTILTRFGNIDRRRLRAAACNAPVPVLTM